MAAPALPRGWQNWPKAQLEELLAGLETIADERASGKGPWLCDVPDCDGKPHKGRRNPHSRAEQRAPAGNEWDHWLLLAGRGFGKTRTGAEWAIGQAKANPSGRGALVAATAADVRDVMVEGESGILACARSSFRPRYEPSKRRLTYPNGAIQTCYSADEPERLRGPQHHYAWCIAEGEPVLTERGWVPIERVRPGDVVATRTGWAPCSGAVLTKQDAELIELVTESGARVTCTPEHRIATSSTGWTEARNIKPGDTIEVWSSSTDRARPRHGSSGADDATTGRTRRTTGTLVDGCCTGTCGSRPTGTSPRDTSSTTSTTTRPTTNSATCGACRAGSTSPTMPVTGTRPGHTTTSTGPQSARRRGQPASLETWSVSGAVAHTGPPVCEPNTAPPTARPERVVGVSRPRRRADVYDIGVPGHGEFVVGGVVVHNCDELAAWRYLQHAWDMLGMGMRLGDHPRICITTTPRPLPLIKELVASERCHKTRGSTYANLHNLAPTFARTVLDRYAGTELGRQELDAEILEDIAGALVRRAHLRYTDTAPELDLVVVGVDPAGTGTGDEAGVVVVGRGKADGLAYVLDDRSRQMSARETGLTAWRALYDHEAAYIVYEDNFGKQWLRDGLVDAYADLHSLDAAERDEMRRTESGAFPFLRKVNAQHGKVLRAQPVAMRYEQGKVVHVGQHGKLEDQLCVVGGTLIETRRGHVPVELVRAGDEVMTRRGWAPVEWSGQTGTTDQLTGLQVVECVLWTTPAHPVWSASQDRFVRADSVGMTDQLDVRLSPASSVSQWLGTAGGGTWSLTGTTATPRVSCCIELSGKRTTAPSRTIGRSITGTTTSATTRSGIFDWSHAASTEPSTSRGGLNSTPPSNGPVVDARSGPGGSPASWPAIGADQSSSRPGSVPPTAVVRARAVDSVPVYNLMVRAGHLPEYYANGILVHNCTWDPHDKPNESPDRIDALVHAVTYLLKREKTTGSIALPHAAGLGRARGITTIGRTA